MADVQLGQVWNFVDELDVVVIDAVTGVDLQLQLVRSFSRRLKIFEFLFLNLFRKRVREFSSMQLNHLDR